MRKSRAADRNSDIPETMKAAAMDRFGPPQVLEISEVPVPRPQSGEVLIAIHTAGVGVWDASIRDGSWKPFGRAKFPLIPGSDGAGIIVAKGPRVRNFEVGDEVYAVNGEGYIGFYAEYIAVSARTIGRVPKPLDLLQAGAAAVTALTALQGIDDTLQVREGKTVLIFGASGAVGTLAVQFAKRRHARVVAAVRGRDATLLVKKLGADDVIDVKSAKSIDRLRELVPDGFDAVLALAGGDVLERCLDHLHAGGRIAYPNGVEPEPVRRRGIRIDSYNGMPGTREFAKLKRAIEEAKLVVPIAAAYPLAQAAKAHTRMEKGHILGRIVLQVRGRSR